VNVLYEDRQGKLWAGTDDGVYSLDQSEGRFRRVELNLPQPVRNVWAFLEDQDGSLWIATWFGLVRRQPDGRVVHYADLPSPKGDEVRALLLDREGKLWLGTSAHAHCHRFA
jgi:ligand-binding sensor domain-containing protein